MLGFARSLAGVALRLSVVRVAQGIGVDPLRPPLAWEVWNGEAWIAADVFTDSTGGLNRSGEIVLMVPSEHESLTLGKSRAFWIRVRLTTPQPHQPTYQATPIGSTICRSRPSARPCAPNMPRGSPAEVLGPLGRQPRAGVQGQLPAGPAPADRRDGPGHRCRELGGMVRGGGLLAVRRDGQPLRLGFGDRRSSGSDRGSGTPTGRCASTAGSRATAPRSR